MESLWRLWKLQSIHEKARCHARLIDRFVGYLLSSLFHSNTECKGDKRGEPQNCRLDYSRNGHEAQCQLVSTFFTGCGDAQYEH
jgi:hypothetical protein